MMKRKPPFLKPFFPVALVGIAVFGLVGITCVSGEPEADKPKAEPEPEKARVDPLAAYDRVPDKDHPGLIARVYKWTRDIAQFDAGLRYLVETADMPDEEDLKKRLESRTGEVEVITDGYGGVVDFNAAKGTVQYEASKRFGRMWVDWEFELATDTEIYWDESTHLAPKIARTAKDGKEDSEQPILGISIEKASAGPFRAGDRVRLKALIDDFSRFRKRYSLATGLVAIYHLEEGPNPFFELKLAEAEVTLVKRADQDACKSQPANPEEKPETGDGENE